MANLPDPNKDPALKAKINAFVNQRRELLQHESEDDGATADNTSRLAELLVPGSAENVAFMKKFHCQGRNQNCRNAPNRFRFMCPRGHIYCDPCFQVQNHEMFDNYPDVGEGRCGFKYSGLTHTNLKQALEATGFGYGMLPPDAKEKPFSKEKELLGMEIELGRCLRRLTYDHAADPLFYAMTTKHQF